MADIDEERGDETFWKDTNWLAFNGGFVHSNNVLFYFAQSPFFDRQSNNSSLFAQAIANPAFYHWLGTRKTFENQLSKLSGIEYVVEQDPLESQVFVDGQASGVWVIRKQDRQKRPGEADQLVSLAYYYILNDAVYQAPSVGRVLTNRLLSTVTSLTNMLSAAAPLPVFAPSYGHTYLSPTKPKKPSQIGMPHQSREASVAPGSQVEVGKLTNHPTQPQDLQTLIDAIRMTGAYSREYMDEAPLVGEPGSFRISKTKELNSARPPQQASQDSRHAIPAAKNSTPTTAALQLPSPPPPIDTDIPAASSKKSAKGTDRSPTTPGSAQKPRRRKSKANVEIAGLEKPL